MTWTAFWNGIGDFFTWSFQFMKPIGNGINYPLWIFIAFMVFFQIYRIAQQNKKADREGTLR